MIKCIVSNLFLLMIFVGNTYGQNISGVINLYTPVTQIYTCPSSVVVGSSAGFNVGDRVLIIQMQGASIDRTNTAAYGTVLNYNEAGNYEFADIASITGTTIRFKNNLLRSYDASGSVQLVRVPVYGNANVTAQLTCLPWNGSTGGVLVFEANNVALNADIDVSGKGFMTYTTMAQGWNCDPLDTVYFDAQASITNALKGEGIVTFNAMYATGRGPNANGGGGGNNTSGGGGGGSNYGKGGIGGYEWNDCFYPLVVPVNRTKSGLGGRALAYNNASNKIFMGGGGGMGQGTTQQINWGGSAGGNGGGIIIIKAGSINGNNYSINSKGDDGIKAKWDGAGGGGAGGAVLLDIGNYTGSLNLNIQGGKGGDPNDLGNVMISETGPGGGGGGGMLWVQGISFPANILLNAAGGANGLYYTDFDTLFTSAFGAEPGADGGALINLSIPYAPPITLPSQEICYGASATLSCPAPGNITPYSYSWNPGNLSGNPVTVSPTMSTIYTLTITDGNGCAVSPINDTVFVIGQLTAHTPVQKNVSCYGGIDGSILGAGLGGAPGYTYNWSNGSTASSISGLSIGSYSLTITDSKGCTARVSTIITEPPVLSTTVSSIPAGCNGASTGSMSVLVSGGTPGYTYLWSTGNTTAPVTGVQAGIYSVTVTDNNACKIITFTQLTDPAPLASQLASVDALCNGSATGTAVVNGSGGTSPYSYNWNNGQTTQTASGLAAGVYTVTLTDANNCIHTNTVNVSEPPALAFQVSSTDANCSQSNGSATVNVSGGSGGYMYSWSNGQTTATANGISAATYTCIITDMNACTATATVTVNNVAGVTINSITPAHVLCNGENNGTANVSASQGSLPYSYLWSNGQTGITASNLQAAVYSVTVTDSDGCTHTNTIIITEPPAITNTVTVTAPSCTGYSDGVAGIAVSGGTPGYNYSWSTGQNTVNVSGLSAGVVYTVTVSDANNCQLSVQVNVTDPPQLTLTTVAGKEICLGQVSVLTAAAAGGNGGYNYNWSSGQNGASIQVSPVQQTIYTVTVTDNKGCTAIAVSSVSVNPLPVVSFTADNTEGCGPLCVIFTNTTPNSSAVVWNFGDNTTSVSNSNVSHCYTNSGSYNVELFVTDIKGCQSSLKKNNYITVFPDPVAAFSSSPTEISILESTVYFTDLSLSAAGWSWNFGTPNDDGSLSQHPTFTYQDTGKYQVKLIVTSDKGCIDSVTRSVYIAPDYIAYIPNTFTPNYDGKNDVFFPVTTGAMADQYEMRIFDRWGEMIFKTNNLYIGWDGRVNSGTDIAQEDVYIWQVSILDVKGKRHKYTGHVNLLK